MRRLTVTTLGAMIAVLAMAGAANALTISVNWIGTSGTGATGTNKIDVTGAPETLTAEIIVNYGATGLKAVSVSFEWDTALVFKSLVTGAECPATPAPQTGACTPGDVLSFGATLGPVIPGVTVTGNKASSLEALNATASVTGPSFFTLAQLVFNTTGSNGAFALFYKPAIDAVTDSGNNIIANASNNVGFGAQSVGTVTAPKVIPEPGTLALLGLGIGTLGFAGRRRKR